MDYTSKLYHLTLPVNDEPRKSHNNSIVPLLHLDMTFLFSQEKAARLYATMPLHFLKKML
jgi:hypothetical protein